MVYLTETELRAHIANCEYLSTDETVHYDECNFSEIFFFMHSFVSWKYLFFFLSYFLRTREAVGVHLSLCYASIR